MLDGVSSPIREKLDRKTERRDCRNYFSSRSVEDAAKACDTQPRTLPSRSSPILKPGSKSKQQLQRKLNLA